MTKCPECGADLNKEKREISPGIYANVEVCPNCEDEWVDESQYEELRSLFKRKVFKVGGSLAVRIPKEIADLTGVNDGDDLFITTKDRRIILEHK
jgi:Zn-finger nucleic acid-binding protein